MTRSEPERRGFYARTLRALLDRGVLRPEMSVLVVCGGPADRDAFLDLGFSDVTVSGFDELAGGDVRPYRWSVQDAEALGYTDSSFDLVAVSAGLHHCRSPHRALLEMYRVARDVIFVLESRDSMLMRRGAALGFVDDYELTAVAAHGFRTGGVANSATPNYVYRWTEREVEKTIASYAPHARHRFLYFHELELPMSVLAARRNALWAFAARVLEPALDVTSRLFPGQANLFAFAVLKPRLPRDLQPWMTVAAGRAVPNEPWIESRLATHDDDPHDG